MIQDQADYAKGIIIKNEQVNSWEQLINRVYNGDIFELMKMLPDESVDVIFSDPDYNVGIKYDGISYTKNFDEYIEWYIELAKESIRVLKEDGNMFFINYPRQNAYLWVRYLDRACYDVQEYVWVYNTMIGMSDKRFTTAHRSILHCRKSKDNKFYKEHVALPYKNPWDKRIQQRILGGSPGRMPYSWLYYDIVRNTSREKVAEHPCQIPQDLSKTLILAASQEGDLVLVHFGGSGAEVELCVKYNRNFLTAEIVPKYCDIIAERAYKAMIDKNSNLF